MIDKSWELSCCFLSLESVSMPVGDKHINLTPSERAKSEIFAKWKLKLRLDTKAWWKISQDVVIEWKEIIHRDMMKLVSELVFELPGDEDQTYNLISYRQPDRIDLLS